MAEVAELNFCTSKHNHIDVSRGVEIWCKERRSRNRDNRLHRLYLTNVDSSRLVSANGGHSLTALRMGQTDPCRSSPFVQNLVDDLNNDLRNGNRYAQVRCHRFAQPQLLSLNPNRKWSLLVGQVSPIACQLGPGLALAAPPPMMLVPFMSQIEVWPLVF